MEQTGEGVTYTEPVFLNIYGPRNRFQGLNSASLCCSLAGRYDNPIPTRCLAPIDCLKIPALSKDEMSREIECLG
jgi:hypothetical protein